MLLNKFELPLDLDIKESVIFKRYIIVVVLLSIISIFLSSIPFLVKILTVLFITFYVLYFYRENYKKNKITRLIFNNNPECKIEIDNNVIDVQLYGECIVTYYLSWLNFKTTDNETTRKHFHLLLLPDSMSANQLRQLRARLRFLNFSNESEMEKV